MKRFLCIALILGVWWFAPIVNAIEPPTHPTPLAKVQLDKKRLRVHFIDVGPGLAVLVQTPDDRQQLFIDGGDKGATDIVKQYVKHFATQKRFTAAIVTHADTDHYRGMKPLFEDYTIAEFWYSGYASEELLKTKKGNPSEWKRFLDKVRSTQDLVAYVPLGNWVDAGDIETIDDGETPDDRSDDVFVQHLHVDRTSPEKDPYSGRQFTESERRNSTSLVFKLIYKDVSFLITGDINGRNKKHTKKADDEEIDSEEYELCVSASQNQS